MILQINILLDVNQISPKLKDYIETELMFSIQGLLSSHYSTGVRDLAYEVSHEWIPS